MKIIGEENSNDKINTNQSGSRFIDASIIPNSPLDILPYQLLCPYQAYQPQV